jgi:hypothetical protein
VAACEPVKEDEDIGAVKALACSDYASADSPRKERAKNSAQRMANRN